MALLFLFLCVVKLTPKALLDKMGQLEKERKSTFSKLSKIK